MADNRSMTDKLAPLGVPIQLGLVREALAMAIVALVAPAMAAAQSLELHPVSGPAVVVKADEIAAMAHRTVMAAIHGLSGAYGGVPLNVLLSRIGAPQGESLRGAAMTQVVTVRACDGYRVVLTLPEVDPAFRAGTVILADTVDGHPLDAHEGPFRLVVDGDKRAGRSARCVTSIAIVAVP